MEVQGAPRNVVRIRAVGICAAMLLVLAGCSSGEPSASPSEQSPTVSPTTGPSESPDPGTGRDPEMTDLETLARVVSPQTGEAWFAAPREISFPSWATGDGYLDLDSVTWYELGTRGGTTIVGYGSDAVEEFFERNSDGSWEWIPFPSARASVSFNTDTYGGYSSVHTNNAVYYDSLTLPSESALPTEEPLSIPYSDWGSPTIPGHESLSPAKGEAIPWVGGYEILRFENRVRWIWDDYYPVTAPPDLSYRDFFYVLATPYGMYIPLDYIPLGAMFEDVNWTIQTNIAPDGYSWLADINDTGNDFGCGSRGSDHNTIIVGLSDDDWVEAGTTAGGTKVYVPTEDNPLAQPMYESYRALREANALTYVSLASWIRGPALIGYRSPESEEGEWIVYLNGAYSGRTWC